LNDHGDGLRIVRQFCLSFECAFVSAYPVSSERPACGTKEMHPYDCKPPPQSRTIQSSARLSVCNNCLCHRLPKRCTTRVKGEASHQAELVRLLGCGYCHGYLYSSFCSSLRCGIMLREEAHVTKSAAFLPLYPQEAKERFRIRVHRKATAVQ
jgi:hypothetical protein